MNKVEANRLVNDIWKTYDKDHSGELDKKECVKLLKDISEVCHDWTIFEQSETIIGYLDKDNSGTLSKKEFVKLLVNNID